MLKPSRLVTVIFIVTAVLSWWWYKAPRRAVGQQISSEEIESNAVRFLVVGDSGSGNQNQMAVARAMEDRCQKNKIDAILHVGDINYQSGVESIDDPQWEEKVELPYGTPCLKMLNIYPVLGNHDYKGDPQAVIDYSQKNRRWRMPQRFYEVKFGELVDLVAFDSNVPDWCLSTRFCAVDFMREAISQSHAKWRIVMAHHPVVSSSAKYPNVPFVYEWLMKNTLCSKVELFLMGHAHHLEHANLPECKTDFALSGGGGADLYEIIKGKPLSYFAASTHGFLEVAFNPEKMELRFFDQNGQQLYEYVRNRD